jgi:hypothetical protein
MSVGQHAEWKAFYKLEAEAKEEAYQRAKFEARVEREVASQ